MIKRKAIFTKERLGRYQPKTKFSRLVMEEVESKPPAGGEHTLLTRDLASEPEPGRWSG